MKHSLAKRAFRRITPQVKAEPVRHISEPDAGVWIDEPEPATESGGSKRFIGGSEPALGKGLK
jgi:hypothetical protein